MASSIVVRGVSMDTTDIPYLTLGPRSDQSLLFETRLFAMNFEKGFELLY